MTKRDIALMKKAVLCGLPYLLSFLIFFTATNAFGYQTDEDTRSLEFSKSVEETIKSNFGDCPVYMRKSCSKALRMICDRQIDTGQTSRTGYYLDFDLNSIAPSCNWFDQKNCSEPAAWQICEKVKKYRGIAPQILTAAAIKLKFGYNCTVTETCNDMLLADCDAARDGPAYLLDSTLNVLAPSGGICMAGCAGYEDQWKKWNDCRKQANDDLLKKLESGGDLPPSAIMRKY